MPFYVTISYLWDYIIQLFKGFVQSRKLISEEHVYFSNEAASVVIVYSLRPITSTHDKMHIFG